MVSWNLPEEITLGILLRLPVRYVMRCGCVCKAWRRLTEDPTFIDSHLARSSQSENPSILLGTMDISRVRLPTSIDPVYRMKYNAFLVEHVMDLGVHNQPIAPLQFPPHAILGSSNGLLCLSSFFGGNRHTLCVYNPCTRESIELPRSNTPFYMNDCTSGFGYIPSSKEYKVFGFLLKRPSVYSYNTAEAEVHTVGTNSWRRIVDVPFRLLLRPFNVLVNGALHWLAYYPHDSVNLVIGSFDLGSEQFRVLHVPPNFSPINIRGVQAEEVNGSLFLVDFSSSDHIDMWEMKQYDVEDSWVKRFVLPILELVTSICLLWISDSCEILLRYNNTKFIAYNPIQDQVRNLDVQSPLNVNVIHSFVHIESLVSPRRLAQQVDQNQSGVSNRAFASTNLSSSARQTMPQS